MYNSIILSTQGGQENMLGTLIPLGIVFVLFFFMMNRQDKKKAKEELRMRESMEVGDEIVTIGGIVARVIKKEEETVLLETGTDRTKLRLLTSAIAKNNTAGERVEEDKVKAREAAVAAKEAKKAEKEKK